MLKFTRRAMLLGAVAFASFSGVGFAQDKPVMKFSSVFSAQDIRAKAVEQITEAMADDITIQPYFGSTLFRQGAELVAMQRNNLELSNIAPQEIGNQIPAWTMLSAAYVFRDVEHLQTFFKSEVGAEFIKMAEDQLNIKILAPNFFGMRQVGLVNDKKITTPADLNGIKLRMPGGETWQFLGQSLGANPTPMDYAELYTGLQTGAVDGQDNPLPNVQNMKFYEVMKQVVLTGHLVGYDIMAMSKKSWESLSPETQEKLQKAVDDAMTWSAEQHVAQEDALKDQFRTYGLDVYEPDVAAFSAYAQQKYLEDDISKNWVPGSLDRVNAL